MKRDDAIPEEIVEVRDIGLCVWQNCRQQAEVGRLCKRHADMKWGRERW